MQEKDQYKAVISEVIAKQIVILGPEISILKAKNVPEIELSSNGVVIDIKGDPQVALQKLIDQYVELSGQIVRNALGPIFTKYPSVKHNLRA